MGVDFVKIYFVSDIKTWCLSTDTKNNHLPLETYQFMIDCALVDEITNNTFAAVCQILRVKVFPVIRAHVQCALPVTKDTHYC